MFRWVSETDRPPAAEGREAEQHKRERLKLQFLLSPPAETLLLSFQTPVWPERLKWLGGCFPEASWAGVTRWAGVGGSRGMWRRHIPRWSVHDDDHKQQQERRCCLCRNDRRRESSPIKPLRRETESTFTETNCFSKKNISNLCHSGR